MDREKVIKGLEHCLTIDSPCGDCPYYSYEDIQELECERNLRNDTIDLLKEQEAKPPAIMQDIEGIWLTCSMCGYKLHPILAMKMDTYFSKFCSECGQAVKWE